MKISHPKHSVVIITYNQEKLIGRAINSLLCQKEWLFEIVICDDHSIDNNWNVILDYQQKHPNLIKPFRNPHNLGIFGNIESSWNKVNGDIIWYLSGDDEYCNNLFANANSLINCKNIDLKNDYFTLYFDWKSIDLIGKEKLYSNALILKHDATSLKLRGLICNRTTGISKNVVNKFYPIRKDIGIFADGLIDIQTQLFSVNNYYSPFVGSIYYTGIGIGSKTNYIKGLNSYFILWDEFENILYNISSKDRNWIQYQKHRTRFLLKKNLSNFFIYLKYYIKSSDPKFGVKIMFVELLKLFSSVIKQNKQI